jgi:enamine deaminase RidA (YjgF/YER057c/UK114 family)
MRYFKKHFGDIDVSVSLSVFYNAKNTCEAHLIFLPGKFNDFDVQQEKIQEAYLRITSLPELSQTQLLFKRYFVSDVANQLPKIEKEEQGQDSYAISIVQQPPLNGSKIVLWAYQVTNASTKRLTNSSIVRECNGYKHVWASQMFSCKDDTEEQTTALFLAYSNLLQSINLTVKDNCIRTWLFVQNIDLNYCKVVEARKKFFNEIGLTPETHFIASTGIEGKGKNPHNTLIADAYAIGGITNEQVFYLKAPGYLNPTYEYGVTFERGTVVDYGDRRHIFISGTASINNKGQVIHQDVLRQAIRTLDNIEALLMNAKADFEDVAQMIVYLRDINDYTTVNNYLEKRCSQIPWVIVHAPVCRPGWLIEIECIAIKAIGNTQWRNY